MFDLNATIERFNFSVDGGYTSPDSDLRCLMAAPGTAYNFRSGALVIKRRPELSTASSNAMTVIKENTTVSHLYAEGFVWITSNSNNASSINATRIEFSGGAMITPTYNQTYGNKFSMTANNSIIVKSNR